MSQPPQARKENLLAIEEFSSLKLRALFALADAGSISAAANQMNRSAGRVSQEISELDAFFGFDLRDHSGRLAVLSDKGRKLVALLRQQLKVLQDFRDQARGNLDSVGIAAGDSLLHLSLFPKLSKIHSMFKRTEVHISGLSTFEIIQGLQNHAIDLGILREDSVSKKRPRTRQNRRAAPDGDVSDNQAQRSLDYVELGEYKYAAFVPRKLWDKGRIRDRHEREIFGLRFAMIRNHWDTNFIELARERDIAFGNVRVWCENFTQVFRLVNLQDYVGILPIFCSDFTSRQNFRWFVPTFLKEHSHKIVLAWNRSLLKVRTPLKPFIELLTEQLKFSDHAENRVCRIINAPRS